MESRQLVHQLDQIFFRYVLGRFSNQHHLYESTIGAPSKADHVALLDFQIPQSLILQLANAPTPIFFTSYSLDALPQLNGSVSYVTTSEALDGVSQLTERAAQAQHSDWTF